MSPPWISTCTASGAAHPVRRSLPRAIQLVWSRKSATKCLTAIASSSAQNGQKGTARPGCGTGDPEREDQQSQKRGTPSPALAGEGGAKRRMRGGPSPRPLSRERERGLPALLESPREGQYGAVGADSLLRFAAGGESRCGGGQGGAPTRRGRAGQGRSGANPGAKRLCRGLRGFEGRCLDGRAPLSRPPTPASRLDAQSAAQHVTAMLVLRLRLRFLAPPRASAALG